jgi:hypothetical protein
MYNLPPGGGGSRGNNDNGELQGLLNGLGIMALVRIVLCITIGIHFLCHYQFVVFVGTVSTHWCCGGLSSMAIFLYSTGSLSELWCTRPSPQG